MIWQRVKKPVIVLGLVVAVGAGSLAIQSIGSNKTLLPGVTLFKAQETADNSYLFSGDDVRDFAALVTKLERGDTPLSQFLWSRFSERTKRVLADATVNPRTKRTALVKELNAILQRGSIHETERFADVTLSQKTADLLAQSPQGEDLIRLNRFLLEDAYPMEIAKRQTVARGEQSVTRLPFSLLMNWKYIEDQTPIPDEILKFNGKYVEISGYLLPYGGSDEEPEYMLFESMFSCCFGQAPEINHIVLVKLRGKRIEDFSGIVSVRGIFKAGELRDDGFLVALYQIQADRVISK